MEKWQSRKFLRINNDTADDNDDDDDDNNKGFWCLLIYRKDKDCLKFFESILRVFDSFVK